MQVFTIRFMNLVNEVFVLFKVECFCNEQILDDYLKLVDVAYITGWKRVRQN